MNVDTLEIKEIELDLIQINENIDILKFKLEILEEKGNNALLIDNTLNELSTMYSIRKGLQNELFNTIQRHSTPLIT